MQIVGRQWAAAFATAVLLHAGVLSAVLWHAPSEGVRHVASAHVRVSLGTVVGTSDGVSVAASEVAEAGLATAGEVIAASSAEGWTPAVPEPPTLRPIGAAAVRAIESVRVAFDAAPVESADSTLVEPADSTLVEPADSTPVEESLPVESAPAKSVKATRGAEVAKAARLEESPPVKPVDAPLAVEPAEAKPTDAMSARELAEAAPIRTSTRVDPAVDAVQVGTSSPVEPVRAEPMPASLAGEPNEETLIGPRLAVESAVAGAATPTGGSAPRANTDYLALVQAWLEKHKEYPYRARLRREEGTAVLYFVVDRDGRVRDSELRQSTGHALLDREVLAMIERAQPLPRVPGDPNSVPLELIVPVRFRLR